MKKDEQRKLVPVWEKTTLTIEEAAAYTGIGENMLREMTLAEDCDFVLWVGSRRLLKRKKLEEYLERTFSV